jgi:hypothetical protein
VEQGATSEDSESSDLECWVPNAAGQQQLREEEAARQAERETVQDQAAIATRGDLTDQEEVRD